MKKLLFIPAIAVLFITLFTSCFKEKRPSCITNTLEKDKQVIDSFLRGNGLTAAYTYDAQVGAYYSISAPGTGSMPTQDSLVAFKYEGKLLDGTKFDEGEFKTPTYSLRQFSQILGAIYSLSKINNGGNITIIIPSSYAFGCTGAYNSITGQLVVPANAQVIYSYWLTGVKSQY